MIGSWYSSKVHWGVGLALILFIAAASSANGQRITGAVIDETTGAPVANAVVFFDRSTLASVTGQDGHFDLPPPPLSLARLVASAPGYLVTDLVVSASGADAVELALRARTAASAVGAIEDRNDALTFLSDALFTWSGPGRSCALVNPDVLSLSWSEPERDLSASASEPLIIECDWTGYRIRWFDFRFRGGPDEPLWYGRMLFEELPADHRDAGDWKGNRKRAYRGSFRHFVESMVRDRLSRELFSAYHSEGFSTSEISPIVEMRQSSRLANQIRPVLQASERDESYALSFSGFLYVSHPYGESIDRRFVERYWPVSEARGLMLRTRRGAAASWLYLPYARASIDRTGSVLDYPVTESVRMFGDMGMRRIGSALPVDYRPE